MLTCVQIPALRHFDTVKITFKYYSIDIANEIDNEQKKLLCLFTAPFGWIIKYPERVQRA
jgi:hypothetical protein